MTPHADYPRVLIVGPNFDLVTGSGITLTNLFRGWPAARLAVVSSLACQMDPAPCSSQYLLGQAELRWIRPLRFARSFGHAPGDESWRATPEILRSAPAQSGVASGRAWLRSIAKAVFHAGVRGLGSDDYLRPLAVSEQLVAWSTTFRPDLIYTHLGSLSMIRLTLQLASALRKPVVVHMMDDWPEVIYRHGLMRRRLRARTDRGLRAIIDLAAARLSISEAMANEYAERYGHDWTVFHNPIDLVRWSKARRTCWDLTDGFQLLYSGRIGPGTESSLLDVSRAVALLRSRGRQVSFDIHSWYFDKTNDRRFADFEGVTTHGAIADSKMPAMLAQADTLVLPFDFHGEAATLFRLSFPTKAPGYMATGTPVLVYAPSTHAVAAEAASHGWGYVVSGPRIETLVQAISRLMDSEALRRELGLRAMKEVEERYDADEVRARLVATLSSVARSPSIPWAAAVPGGEC